MKKKLLVLVMLTFTLGAFAQVMVMDTLNGHFERGTVLHSSWRALEVADGALVNFLDEGSAGAIAITDDSNNGNFAVEVTMPSNTVHATVVEAVFDVYVPVVVGKQYIFNVAAYASVGDGRIRPHCTVYDADWGIVGDWASDDLYWNLGSFYQDYEWILPEVIPADAAFVNLGFRMMATDGGRWSATDVTMVVDDFELWEESVGVMYQLTATADGNGAVEIFPLSPSADGKYWQNADIQLAAVPNDGAVFYDWSGDVTSTEDTVVVAMDAAKAVTASFTGATGIANTAATVQISAFPNPVVDQLHISSAFILESVSIFNITGQMVKEVIGNISVIDVEGLDAGLYIVKLKSQEGSVTQRILKR